VCCDNEAYSVNETEIWGMRFNANQRLEMSQTGREKQIPALLQSG